MAVPLTSLCHGAGCGCKLSAADLRPIVACLPRPTDPRVLVAADTADDAGVVQLTDELAIVQTADFFTPIVDDPYAFGRIAATNALSDIYAMGGDAGVRAEPRRLPARDARGRTCCARSCAAARDAVAEAGASIVGGHSIDDPEPKYGLAVTGVVHPDAVLTNAGGRAGDALVLTKPLGAGTVATAIKRGLADAALVERGDRGHDDAERPRRRCRRARRARTRSPTSPASACSATLHELAAASGLAAEIDAAAVPAIDGVLELLSDERALAGGSQAQPRRRRRRSPRLAGDVARAAAPARVRRDDLRRPARRRAARARGEIDGAVSAAWSPARRARSRATA